MSRPPLTTILPTPLGVLLLLATLAALIGADGAFADATANVIPVQEAAPPTSAATSIPAPAPAESPPSTTPTTTTTTPPPAGATTPGATPPATTTSETTTVPAPEVRTQRPQPPAVSSHGHGSAPTAGPPGKAGANPNPNAKVVSPSALTPPIPSTLGGSLAGVPSFFIDSFSIPPFLLPIYQAAGAAYGIPWQVLAAINEVETDYGRDLNVSSAGAEGWMQFMPSSWQQYGVDVNNDGFEDPYNPADAVFAAARYLKQAGGATDIRGAIFAYNHSQAYVNSVLLRARLLGGTPPALLGAITGLTEARFPVYAASHYSDIFPTTEGASPHTVAATTIYSQDGAPVIAVQDGHIVRIDQAGPLGRSVTLEDAYGNSYTYAELGTLATLYPVLEAATATPVGPLAPTPSSASDGATRMFRAGSENVYLHPLRLGAQVIAGTVLGHVGPGVQPHIVFQIRPAGAPLIDPKPILDGWVKLQTSSAVKAKGRDPFAKISPTPGQALLESKTQLEQQVPRDHGIHLAACERRLIADGRADRRVLATLAFLSASGLRPTVSARTCTQPSAAAGGQGTTAAVHGGSGTVAHLPGVPPSRRPGRSGAVDDALDISAIDGVPVARPSGQATIVADAVRKLAGLQGVVKPLQISSSTHLPGTAHTVVLPGYAGLIHISFTPLRGASAHAAGATGSGLTPAEWLRLVARLGQVPDPTVSAKPSPAAIPDHSSAAASSATEGK